MKNKSKKNILVLMMTFLVVAVVSFVPVFNNSSSRKDTLNGNQRLMRLNTLEHGTVSISDVTATSGTITVSDFVNGENNERANHAELVLVSGTENHKFYANDITDLTEFSFTLDGLTANTNYSSIINYYHGTSSDVDNVILETDPFTFITARSTNATYGTLINVYSKSNEVKIILNEFTNGDGANEINSIRLIEVNNSEINTELTNPADGPKSFVISNLTANTEYEFRLETKIGDVWSTIENKTIKAKTLENTSPQVILDSITITNETINIDYSIDEFNSIVEGDKTIEYRIVNLDTSYLFKDWTSGGAFTTATGNSFQFIGLNMNVSNYRIDLRVKGNDIVNSYVFSTNSFEDDQLQLEIKKSDFVLSNSTGTNNEYSVTAKIISENNRFDKTKISKVQFSQNEGNTWTDTTDLVVGDSNTTPITFKVSLPKTRNNLDELLFRVQLNDSSYSFVNSIDNKIEYNTQQAVDSSNKFSPQILAAIVIPSIIGFVGLLFGINFLVTKE